MFCRTEFWYLKKDQIAILRTKSAITRSMCNSNVIDKKCQKLIDMLDFEGTLESLANRR